MASREPCSAQDILARGFLEYSGSPSRRRGAAVVLPALAVDALAHGYSRSGLEELRRLMRHEHWPALVARQAGATGNDWDACIAAAAVVLELVCGALPKEAERHLADTEAFHRRFKELRAPFQRFALVVHGRAKPVRLFVSPGTAPPRTDDLRCPPTIEQYPGLCYWLDTERFEGRSHTFLLGLLALERWGQFSLPIDLPIAATGTLGPDGQTILPVDNLAEKRRCWFANERNGLFISSPPASPSGMRDLLRSPHTHEKRIRSFRGKEDEERLERPDDDDPAWNRWIVAGSLHEAQAKIDALTAGRIYRGVAPLPSWNGKSITADAMVPLEIQWESPKNRPKNELSYNDRVLSALWHIVDQRGDAYGIIIYGEPGMGKSILSYLLERRFTTGLLGVLGFGVRRSARELAEDVEVMPEANLPTLLARRAPSEFPLFERLVTQGRLFLILDGLDEVDAQVLPELARPIQNARSWFIATSRNVRQGHDSLPPHVCLTIEPLGESQVREILNRIGREDLAKQFDSAWQYSRKTEVETIKSFLRTPFHLHLLASAVPRGANAKDIEPVELYRRVYAGLLEQAVRDKRLSDKQAEVLKRQLPTVVGELALAWLRTPRGVLTDEDVTACLDDAGFRGTEAIQVRRALEFGYILAPGANNLELTHRTIAEWSAALAIATRIKYRLRAQERESGNINLAARTAIEKAEIAPFISDEHGKLHDSRFWQLLQFHAVSSIAPLVLIERLVGPAAMKHWEYEAHGSSALAAAQKIAALAHWDHAEDARLALGFFARAQLFLPDAAFVHTEPGPNTERDQFVSKIATHVPKDLDAIILIVARTPEQRAMLEADPTLLLPFCPGNHLPLFESLLRRGTMAQRAAILERHAACGIAPPWDLTLDMAQNLPLQIHALEKELESHWNRISGIPYEQRRHDDAELNAKQREIGVLKRAEAALYLASARAGRELPWQTMRRRITAWPHHLEKALVYWFREGKPDPFAPVNSIDPAGPHRDEAFSLLISHLGEVEEALLKACRAAMASPHAKTLACALRRRIDDEDRPGQWGKFSSIAERAGWTIHHVHESYGDDHSDWIDEVVRSFWHWDGQRRIATNAVEALAEGAKLADIVERRWKRWTADSAERGALLAILIEKRILFSCIAIREVIAHTTPIGGDLPYALRPSRDKYGIPILPEHEAQWREIARSGHGRERFLALSWCAERDGIALVDLLADAAEGADPELSTLIGMQLARPSASTLARKTSGHLDEVAAAFPLAYRARIDAPGWRKELLAALAAISETQEYPVDLLELARNHNVCDALPILRERFLRTRQSNLPSVLAALSTANDTETFGVLRDADEIHSIPDPMFELFTIKDLPQLLSSKWLHLDKVRERILSFGIDAHPAIRDAFEWSRAQSEPAGPGAYARGERHHTLTKLLFESADPETLPMQTIVEMMFDIATGSIQSGGRSHSLDAAMALVRRRLELHPDEVLPLEQLAAHPAENIRLQAFNEFTSRMPSSEVVRFGLRMLEAYYLLPEHQHSYLFTTGFRNEDVGVTQRGFAQQVADTVRRHLTSADRAIIVKLLDHKVATLRILACRWISELGTAAWTDQLQRAFDDPDVGVSMAAINGHFALDRGTLGASLLKCSRELWQSANYRALTEWLLGEPFRRWDAALGRRKNRYKALSSQEFRFIAAECVDAACGSKADVWRDYDVPSLLEKLIGKVDELGDPKSDDIFSNAWLQTRAKSSSGNVRSALYRSLARRGAIEIVEDLKPHIANQSADAADVQLAIQILPMLDHDGLAEEIISAWQLALPETIRERASILIYMLEHASVVYSPLVPHLLDVIDEDDEDRSLTAESEELLDRMAEVLWRWGPVGAAPLLEVMGMNEPVHDRGYAKEVLLRAFKGSNEFHDEVQRRSEANAAYRELLADLLRPNSSEALEILRTRLFEEILPIAWVAS